MDRFILPLLGLALCAPSLPALAGGAGKKLDTPQAVNDHLFGEKQPEAKPTQAKPTAKPTAEPELLKPLDVAACQANEQKKKTTADFTNGAAALRAEAEGVEKSAKEMEAMVTSLKADILKCEPTFGPMVAQAIDGKQPGKKNLLEQIRDLGQGSKGAGFRVANAVQGARDRYQKLDFCSVNACTGAFGALGGLFSPVAKESAASLKTLSSLREAYIKPAKEVLEARRGEIEVVLGAPVCEKAKRKFQKTTKAWEGLQRRFAALEKRIEGQKATTSTVTASMGRAPACAVAQK
jgi:hypothetical protein